MKKLHTTAALLATAAFAAALLAGCGNTASSSSSTASSSSTVSSTATSEAGSEAGSEAASSSSAASSGSGASSSAMSDSAASGYNAAGLGAVLDGCVTFEVGTAGGSLKVAQAANALVRYLAANPDAANLGEDAKAWSAGLDEDRKGALTINWQSIYSNASDIVADPESQKDMLTDAGVDSDYTGVDMSGVQAQLDTLNAALGNA